MSLSEGITMSKLNSLIGAVVGTAMDRAAKGATTGDLAHALLAGLRRIRITVASQAGYGAACGLDDSIHEVLTEVQRAMSAAGRPPVPLPPLSPSASRAAIILEDAAMSCLALNGWFPGNTAIAMGVSALTTRLIETLGGVPEWGAVLTELRGRDGAGDEDEDGPDEGRWTTVAIH
jgi:hypothetical protein